ncbi:CPR6 [Symbiodinium sp. KB8]|nr:CPR6 [Symbiodinium sp. KB8]
MAEVQYARRVVNPRVYLEVSIGTQAAGRMEFELYADSSPKTAENFRCLCTGEKGHSNTGVKLHYKHSTFHRLIRGFMVQGGDITAGDGTGGCSIYGPSFPDENFLRPHTARGQLSMANAGPDTNGSQFFLISGPSGAGLPPLYSLFGKIVKGLDVLEQMQSVKTGGGDKPVDDVIINSVTITQHDD